MILYSSGTSGAGRLEPHMAWLRVTMRPGCFAYKVQGIRPTLHKRDQ